MSGLAESLRGCIPDPARCPHEVSELFRTNLCSPSTTHSSQTPPSIWHWSPTHSSMAVHSPLCTAISNASIAYIQYIHILVILLPPKRGQPLYIDLSECVRIYCVALPSHALFQDRGEPWRLGCGHMLTHHLVTSPAHTLPPSLHPQHECSSLPASPPLGANAT